MSVRCDSWLAKFLSLLEALVLTKVCVLKLKTQISLVTTVIGGKVTCPQSGSFACYRVAILLGGGETQQT